MASFSSELSLLIGLGVGIDYALFIVTRYRQGLLRGLGREEAVAQALDTSGRAVLFAGMIVVIAMLGMLLLGVSFLYGVAIAAAVTVAFTVLAALTLLPALLSLFGRGVLRRRERRAIRERRLANSDESPPGPLARMLERHPAAFAIVATAVLIVIAIPFFSMRLGSTDAGADPVTTTTAGIRPARPGVRSGIQRPARARRAGPLAGASRPQFSASRTPSPRPRASSASRRPGSSPASGGRPRRCDRTALSARARRRRRRPPVC